MSRNDWSLREHLPNLLAEQNLVVYFLRDGGVLIWGTTSSKLPFHFCRWILSGKIAPSVVEKQFISSPCLSTYSIVRCTSLSYLHCAEGFPFRFSSSSYIIYFFFAFLVRFLSPPDNNVLLSAGEKFDWIFHQWNSTRPPSESSELLCRISETIFNVRLFGDCFLICLNI